MKSSPKTQSKKQTSTIQEVSFSTQEVSAVKLTITKLLADFASSKDRSPVTRKLKGDPLKAAFEALSDVEVLLVRAVKEADKSSFANYRSELIARSREVSALVELVKKCPKDRAAQNLVIQSAIQAAMMELAIVELITSGKGGSGEFTTEKSVISNKREEIISAIKNADKNKQDGYVGAVEATKIAISLDSEVRSFAAVVNKSHSLEVSGFESGYKIDELRSRLDSSYAKVEEKLQKIQSEDKVVAAIKGAIGKSDISKDEVKTLLAPTEYFDASQVKSRFDISIKLAHRLAYRVKLMSYGEYDSEYNKSDLVVAATKLADSAVSYEKKLKAAIESQSDFSDWFNKNADKLNAEERLIFAKALLNANKKNLELGSGYSQLVSESFVKFSGSSYSSDDKYVLLDRIESLNAALEKVTESSVALENVKSELVSKIAAREAAKIREDERSKLEAEKQAKKAASEAVHNEVKKGFSSESKQTYEAFSKGLESTSEQIEARIDALEEARRRVIEQEKSGKKFNLKRLAKEINLAVYDAETPIFEQLTGVTKTLHSDSSDDIKAIASSCDAEISSLKSIMYDPANNNVFDKLYIAVDPKLESSGLSHNSALDSYKGKTSLLQSCQLIGKSFIEKAPNLSSDTAYKRATDIIDVKIAELELLSKSCENIREAAKDPNRDVSSNKTSLDNSATAVKGALVRNNGFYDDLSYNNSGKFVADKAVKKHQVEDLDPTKDICKKDINKLFLLKDVAKNILTGIGTWLGFVKNKTNEQNTGSQISK